MKLRSLLLILIAGFSITRLPAQMETPADVNAAAEPDPMGKPRTPGKVPADKQNFHIYLLLGQSNMAGRDRRTLDAQTEDPHILALALDEHWVVARDPIHPKQGRTLPGIGPGIPFAREMLKTSPAITIGLVPCAVGGTSLSRWQKGADLYQKALAQAALAAKSGVIKGVLWHQGESDTNNEKNAETHAARLSQMLQDFRADLGMPDLPIVVGQLGDFLSKEKYPYKDTVKAGIKQVGQNTAHTAYADASELGDKGDHLHFSADAATQLGIRFAKCMQALQK